MKRILRKGNPIARLVALWVVFVMVLVPLLENAGPLKKVKAATYIYTHSVTVDLGADRELVKDASGKVYIQPNDIPSNPLEIHYYNYGQTITINLNPTIVGNMKYTVDENTAYSVSNNYTVKTVRLLNAPTSNLSVTEPQDDTISDGVKEYYLAVYMKMDTTVTLDATNNVTVAGSDNYSLMSIYKVEKHTDFGTEGYWIDENGAPVKSGNATNSTAMSIADPKAIALEGAPNGSIYLGRFERYYANANAVNDTNASERQDYSTKPDEIKLYDGTAAITVSNNKVYYAWIDYILDADGGSTYSTYSASDAGQKLNVDTTAPSLNSVVFQAGTTTGGNNLNPDVGSGTGNDKSDDVYYLDKDKLVTGSSYLIWLVLNNNEKNEKDSLQFSFKPVEGAEIVLESDYHSGMTYKLTDLEDKLQQDVLYNVTVKLVDKCGNGEASTPISLGSIKFIDSTLKVTAINGGEVVKPSADPTNQKYTINVKISSGYQLNYVDILDGDNPPLNNGDQNKYLGSVQKSEGLYTATYTFELPDDATQDKLYENLKIVAYDTRDPGSDQNNPANKVTIDLGKYDYDITPPELQSCVLKVTNGSAVTTDHNLYKSVVYLDANQGVDNIDATIFVEEKHYKDTLSMKIVGSDGYEQEFTASLDTTGGTSKYIVNKISDYIQTCNVRYTLYAKLEDSVGNTANNANNDDWIEVGSVKKMYMDLDIVSATLSDGSPAWDVSNVVAPDKAFKNSPSNKIHTFKLEIQSGYPFAQESVVIKDKNGDTLDGGLFDLRQVEAVDGIYGAEITYNFPTPANNDIKLEGIYVEIKDTNTDSTKNTKTINLGDFTYDKTAPDLVALGIYKKVGEDTYVKINDSELSDGKYIVDTTLDETFVVVYGIDETSKLAICDYYFTNKEDSRIEALKVPADDSSLKNIDPNRDEYFIEYTTKNLENLILINSEGANEVTFYAKAVDEAENSTSLVPATYTLVVPNNQLEILEAKLTDQFGNVIDLTEINNGSYIANKKLELHVKAISGYDITTMELLTDSTVYSTTSVTSKYDINNKKYTVEQTLAIPTDISSNQLLKSIQLRVTDTGNPAMTIPVGQLLFDMSAPTINHADGSALAEDSTWYQSYNLAIAIKAGAQSVESEIDNVKYSISNSYGDKTDATDGVNYSGAAANINIDLPESYTAAGTKINVSVIDKATNSNTAATSIRVDKTNPVVDELTVNGNPYNSIPLSSSVVVKTTASDNLALAKVSMVVESEDGTKRYPKDFEYDTMAAVSDDGSRVIRNEELSLSDLADGKYNVTVTAYDKSGRVSSVKTTSFSVDSTKPVVTVKIAEGTKGGKQSSTNFDGTARDYYYSSNVGLELTYTEINLDEVVVTDNGSKVSLDWTYDSATGKHVASYKSTSEGLHQVIISAKDKTGNEAESKTIYFVKDTSAPTISAIVNGAINYTDSTGSLIFTNDSTVAYSVSDANEDKGDFNYQLIKNVPDEPVSTGDYVKTAVRTFTYTEEADYTINVFSIDMASNKSATKTVSFRLDKTAPNISIGGIGDGGSSSTPVTVSLNMQELFWSDATGTVEIYMKSGEGFGEELIEEITYTPTGRNTAISRTFSESGIYRIVFNAQDNAGHTANAESAFTIDTEVPVVTLEGVSNFDVTDKDVVITSTITEKFYASKKVTITGSVTDDTGKVTPITIDDYSPTANPTVINHTFSDDGIYDLTISCVDIVGNTDSKTVHFTIDKSNPVIGDLSDYDGKTLTSFEWDKDLDELVSDLTVCDVHMYLNGQEYNGEDAVEDGSYVLLITAEDELGHKTEKSVEFVLDTKAPVFIVTGVEDKEKKLEPYNISVSLQLEEDTLTSVTLNGKVVTITNNVATIDVTEIGEYKLYMEAVDAAGNTSSAEYEFELISEKEFNFWIIIGIAALLLLIILFIILGKRKKDKE